MFSNVCLIIGSVCMSYVGADPPRAGPSPLHFTAFIVVLTQNKINLSVVMKVNAVKNEEASQVSRLEEEIRALKQKLAGQASSTAGEGYRGRNGERNGYVEAGGFETGSLAGGGVGGLTDSGEGAGDGNEDRYDAGISVRNILGHLAGIPSVSSVRMKFPSERLYLRPAEQRENMTRREEYPREMNTGGEGGVGRFQLGWLRLCRVERRELLRGIFWKNAHEGAGGVEEVRRLEPGGSCSDRIRIHFGVRCLHYY